MVDIKRLEEAIKEIKELKKLFYERNGNSSLRIPNKDFNLWIVGQLIDMKKDVASNKAKIKMLTWGIGAGVPLLVFVLSYIF